MSPHFLYSLPSYPFLYSLASVVTKLEDTIKTTRGKHPRRTIATEHPIGFVKGSKSPVLPSSFFVIFSFLIVSVILFAILVFEIMVGRLGFKSMQIMISFFFFDVPCRENMSKSMKSQRLINNS